MPATNKKIGGCGFHHVAIKVGDFDATLKFYLETMGFVKKMAWGEGNERAAMLDTGDGNFLEVFAGGPKQPKPDGTYVHLALRTSNCAQALERVRAAGVTVTMEPTKLPGPANTPQICIAFFKGPDGEVIEFIEGGQ